VERACEEKVLKYARNVRFVLQKVAEHEKSKSDYLVSTLMDYASRYLFDAEWYLQKGDCLTALACVSYAEGLLDALRIGGILDFSWPDQKERPRRVLVGGVFDIIHPGHIYFLTKASSLGLLHVVVASDETVRESKDSYPVFNEQERLQLVQSLKPVYRAFPGMYPPDFRSYLAKIRPEIVLLGHDQGWLEEKIRRHLEELGLNAEVLVLNEKLEGYSSSIVKARVLRTISSR
jgi:cytidyltransferase-related domain